MPASEKALSTHLSQLLQCSLASSTRTTCSTGLRRFSTFCAQHNLASLPATNLTITHFAVAKLASSTIHIYIAAIRVAHKELALHDPPTRHNAQLTLVWQAI